MIYSLMQTKDVPKKFHDQMLLFDFVCKKRMVGTLNNDKSYTAFCRCNDKVLGVCLITIKKKSMTVSFFIKEEYRKRGIGKKLNNMASKFSEKKNIDTIYHYTHDKTSILFLNSLYNKES